MFDIIKKETLAIAKQFFVLLYKQIANIITSIRLFLNIWIIILRCTGVGNLTTFLMTLFSAISDAVDGPIARKLKITSKFGCIYDKSTDKTLTVPMFCFMLFNLWTSWSIPALCRPIIILLSINIIVDIALFFFGLYLLSQGLRTEANRDGKRKMILQCIAVCVYILFNDLRPFGFGIEHSLSLICTLIPLAAATCYCCLSAIGYYQSWKNKECYA